MFRSFWFSKNYYTEIIYAHTIVVFLIFLLLRIEINHVKIRFQHIFLIISEIIF